eukprot:scaffold64293_cov64-Attheya_sp.AAC.3
MKLVKLLQRLNKEQVTIELKNVTVIWGIVVGVDATMNFVCEGIHHAGLVASRLVEFGRFIGGNGCARECQSKGGRCWSDSRLCLWNGIPWMRPWSWWRCPRWRHGPWTSLII